ncbi:hypothetical protein GCM10010171_03460 [Actinokineospora fastidiosa]|uniref:Uncharacterized protein n=1 Tax=Actinokineospora fastidiosa TaxID=1816 RepID=A0A918L6F4_9PSEU|nr:hypothetical protein GCM10010171_03460 [Actinokineospora fastidiosa]
MATKVELCRAPADLRGGGVGGMQRQVAPARDARSWAMSSAVSSPASKNATAALTRVALRMLKGAYAPYTRCDDQQRKPLRPGRRLSCHENRRGPTSGLEQSC